MMGNAKVCKACHVEKPLSDYSPQKNGKFGRTSRCRECKNIQIRGLYKDNLERERQRGRDKKFSKPWYSRFNNYWSVRGKATRIEAERDAMEAFYKDCPEGMEVDHIKPLSRGGTHTLDNVQYLTPLANKLKGDAWYD